MFVCVSRSVSVSSLLHRTISFNQLPGGPWTSSLSEEPRADEEEKEEEEARDVPTIATASTTTLGNFSTASADSGLPWQPEAPPTAQSTVDVGGGMLSVDPARGGYLGRFFPEDKGQQMSEIL